MACKSRMNGSQPKTTRKNSVLTVIFNTHLNSFIAGRRLQKCNQNLPTKTRMPLPLIIHKLPKFLAFSGYLLYFRLGKKIYDSRKVPRLKRIAINSPTFKVEPFYCFFDGVTIKVNHGAGRPGLGPRSYYFPFLPPMKKKKASYRTFLTSVQFDANFTAENAYNRP